uniref:Uncharacterized protein n=2 Tax=Panagrolaimus sp. JU765 TaxID=591449 RepID=A0AC34Q125_9BILA
MLSVCLDFLLHAVQQLDHLRTKDQTSPTALPVVMLVMTIFLSTFFTAMIGTISFFSCYQKKLPRVKQEVDKSH